MKTTSKLALVIALIAMSGLTTGCGGSSSSGSNTDTPETTDAGTDTETDTDTDSGEGDSSLESWLAKWILNTSNGSEQIYASATSSQGVLEDVQLAEQQTIDGVDYVYVEASGIPNYDIEITQDMLDALNTRPRADTDFSAGVTSASVGDVVTFGQDIGYNSSTENCDATGGAGYWPPGPGCPIEFAKTEYFTATPTPAADNECAAGLGATGLMVNGTSIFGWGDGMSYNNEGVWYNLAPVAEQYDVDICGGHAANGEYHHHFYTSCLADLLQDDGSDHSPVYGFAADGYPVYGPYESNGVLAVSGWEARDYGADTSAGGCNTPGERTCTLLDEYDVTQGVEANVSQGPDIGDAVATLSGNTLSATDGYYYEDHYFAGAVAAGSKLDEHNGHDNSDGRGYHYHITLSEESNGKLQPSFPYSVGPSYYGELPDNAINSCAGVTVGGDGPPVGAGGPPDGMGGPPGTEIDMDGEVQISAADVQSVDSSLFLDAGLLSSITTESCTLSGGTSTTCYRIEIAGVPSDHNVGPFCPRNISGGADQGGIWFDGDSSDAYDLSGDFIANLDDFYNDSNWLLYNPATGDVNYTATQAAFEAAARPNVDPQYQNHCVEGDLDWVDGGVSQTFLIPTTPVLANDVSGIRGDVGVSLNGVAMAAPAPVDAILGAYTIAAFDQCGGHINPVEGYHYHASTGCTEYGTQSDGHAPVLGYAMDGFAILAMLNEDGSEPSDLDFCRGHADPSRGYHYHSASAGENMFIGCYAGETGSVE